MLFFTEIEKTILEQFLKIFKQIKKFLKKGKREGRESPKILMEP